MPSKRSLLYKDSAAYIEFLDLQNQMPLRLRNSERSMSVAMPVQIPKDPPPSKTTSDTDTDNSSDDYEFFNPAHPRQVLTCFNELRKNGVFTDVILSADDTEFPCHRAILVAGKCNYITTYTHTYIDLMPFSLVFLAQ